MPDSRLALLAALLVAALLVASLGVGVAPVAAQAVDPHGGKSVVTLRDLDVEQRQRARRLWSEVVCSCSRENWSKTLTNCPDGCSDPQKQQVLQGVAAGRTDDQILADQRSRYGPKVLASPEGITTYLLPFLWLLASVGVVVYVLRRWIRAPAAPEGPSAGGAAASGDAEVLAVERELEELT